MKKQTKRKVMMMTKKGNRNWMVMEGMEQRKKRIWVCEVNEQHYRLV